jgi:hypothetical protein
MGAATEREQRAPEPRAAAARRVAAPDPSHMERFVADVNTLEYDEDIARFNANEGRGRAGGR